MHNLHMLYENGPEEYELFRKGLVPSWEKFLWENTFIHWGLEGEEVVAKVKSLLQEDYFYSRLAVARDLADADFQYRSCIVMAEHFLTPIERLASLVEGNWGQDFIVHENIVYKMYDCKFSFRDQDTGAATGDWDVSEYEEDSDFHVQWNGSYHEMFLWVYKKFEGSDDEVEEIIKNL